MQRIPSDIGCVLIGANSEKVDLKDSDMLLIDSEIPRTSGLASLEGQPNLLLKQAEGLADFGEILVFICKTLKARRICWSCYGN